MSPQADAVRPRPSRRSSVSLRHARVRTKLTLIAATGVLALAVVAMVGVQGLGSVDTKAGQLSQISTALKHIAELRDAEGDMRVQVHVLAGARGTGVRDALADMKTSDAVVDTAVAAVGSSVGPLQLSGSCPVRSAPPTTPSAGRWTTWSAGSMARWLRRLPPRPPRTRAAAP
jgi:hypothetical protein